MRSDFSSSRLVRLLGAWGLAPPAGPGQPGLDFAEHLGLWVSAFDAIRLQSALQALRGGAPASAGALKASTLAELEAQVQRVRGALAHAIGQDPRALAAQPDDPGEAAFVRRHTELQRHMDQMLGPLREQVRRTLSQGSPRLRQIAALDAVLQQVLAAREQQLLAALPPLLARRFRQLRPAQARPPDPQAGADPQTLLALEAAPPDAAPAAPTAWLDAFTADWQQALLAELDLRLEPVAGLLAALTSELKNHLHEQATV